MTCPLPYVYALGDDLWRLTANSISSGKVAVYLHCRHGTWLFEVHKDQSYTPFEIIPTEVDEIEATWLALKLVHGI